MQRPLHREPVRAEPAGHEGPQLICRHHAASLDSAPFAQNPGQTLERVSLCRQDRSPRSLRRVERRGQQVDEHVLGEVAEEQRARHVLRPGPDLVAERVVDREAAHAPGRRRADVVHDRLGHVEAAVAQESQPEREVAVLEVAEEVLVEAAHLEEGVALVEGRRRARREDLAALELPLVGAPPVVAAPGEAAHVVDVARSVEDVRRLRLEEPAGEEGVLRIRLGGVDQALEPVGLGERVGVEQCDPAAALGDAHAEVVSAREAEVRGQPLNLDSRVPLLDPVGRAVAAGVVDDDHAPGRQRLPVERRERLLEIGARVGVDDHDGDVCDAPLPRSGHDRHYTKAPVRRIRAVARVDRASSALGARRSGWTSARVVARAATVPVPVWLTLLVAVSAVIRFVLALQVPAPFIFQDELLYSELAKSFGATGHFALRDVPGLAGVGPVYPVLISPAYALFDNLPHAYAAAKAINSVLMSLAAVPAYLIARRLLSSALSFAAAALAVSIPGLMYSGTIMTENAFYPIFLLWFLALVLTLERPTIPRQIALFVLLGLAYETRSQAVALVPALVTAFGLTIVFDGLFARGRSRARAMLERAASFWFSWLVLAAGAVFFVVVEIGVRGQTVSGSLLKTYSPLGSVNYTAAGVARWFLYLVSEMDIVVGVLPFAAFLVIVALACHRGHTSPALRAFAFATLAASFWLFLEVGAFASSPYSQRLQERNVFYLMPLFVTALVVWAARGAGRTGAATSVAAMVAAALTGIVPVTAFLSSNAVTDSFGLLAVWRPQIHFTVPLEWVTPAIVLIAIGVAAFFLLLPPRLALLAPALVLLFFAFSNREVEAFIGQAGRDSRDAGSQTGRDWIDRAVGRDAQVATLFTNNRNYSGALEQRVLQQERRLRLQLHRAARRPAPADGRARPEDRHAPGRRRQGRSARSTCSPTPPCCSAGGRWRPTRARHGALPRRRARSA